MTERGLMAVAVVVVMIEGKKRVVRNSGTIQV